MLWKTAHCIAHARKRVYNFVRNCNARDSRLGLQGKKTLLNLGNSATYDFCLAMADMDKLEQRRTLQSLILFFKCFKLDGPNYISKFFTPRLTKYNLRDSGLNVVQPPYNSLVMHNSYLYMIAHIWNQLPTVTKSSSTLAQFRARLNNVNFTGCQCMNCI